MPRWIGGRAVPGLPVDLMSSIIFSLVRLAVGGARELPAAPGPLPAGTLATCGERAPPGAPTHGVFPAYAFATRLSRRGLRARGHPSSPHEIHALPARRARALGAASLTREDGGTTWISQSDSSSA